MKITIDVSQMCYEGTGVARYTKGLLSAMLSLGSRFEFVLYAGALKKQRFFYDLKQLAPWNTATWKILPIPPKLAGIVAKLGTRIESLVGKVDLYHSSDWVEFGARSPKVTTIHDLVFIKYKDTVDPLIRRSQMHRLKKIIKDNTHIIADSNSTKTDLIEIYKLADDQIDVVYPGIEEDFYKQSKTDIDRVRQKYNLPAQFVLSVGTQEPRKNLDRLSEACKSLGIPLVLIGRYGWGTATTEEVVSLGYVPDSDLSSLYCASSVFAYPSLYEGFGFPVIEAMACGTPVVTSNNSSLSEIAGSAAVLVDPLSVESIENGIVEAQKNKDKYIKLGLAQSKKYNWADAAKQVLEIYEKVAYRD